MENEFAIQNEHRPIKQRVLYNNYDITSQHKIKEQCLDLDEKFIFRV